MEDSRKPNDSESEATSKKTLKDLEESQKGAGTSGDDDTATPSPDGQLDDDEKQENAGPM